MNKRQGFIRVSFYLLVISSILAIGLYAILNYSLGHSPILCPISRCIDHYFSENPLIFILSLSFSFSVLGTLWTIFIVQKSKLAFVLQILLLPIVTILIAGPIWGMWIMYFDMTTGFFPPLPNQINYLLWGANLGLTISPLVALVSFPINMLGYCMSILMLYSVKRIRAIYWMR